MVSVLVIGASGNVGSAVMRSCLERKHDVTAFLRSPSKLPEDLKSHVNLRVVEGDATSVEALVKAMSGQDAVVQAAVYGSKMPWGTSDSEKVVRSVVSAAKRVQSSRSADARTLRLWALSGQVLLDIPEGGGKIEGDIIPIHPEHYANYAYILQNASELDWSLLCPGKIDYAEPVGPVVRTIDYVGLWHRPSLIGQIPFIGPILNVLYNFWCQRLSYKSVGDFLADNLGPGGDMRGKRVGLLEDPRIKVH
ncbi:hypothetical protein OF83DRAFT_1165040 [Amylostereum chailletii]|nr:hypothetical protein OF83DRAFT_1165040 [Amylostereum chailletii]